MPPRSWRGWALPGKSKARARWRGYGEPARDEDAKGQWRHTQVTRPMWFPSSRTCSACGRVNAKLKRETHMDLPNCGTTHDRNLTAAINLRNLIMPAGRSRDGPGQEAMGQQGRGLRAKVIAVLFRHKKSRPCRGERERDPGAGTKAGVPGVEARVTEN